MKSFFTVFFLIVFPCAFTARAANAAQETTTVTRDKACPSPVSGTIVDMSGALMAQATVQVRSANGTVQSTTQSDTNGSFIISGLPAGTYRLVVSNPDFETKEMPVTLGITEAPAPLRISRR